MGILIIKIRIRTPKGQAAATDKKIRGWLLPWRVVPKVKTNKADSEIIWVVDVDSRKAERIYKNVGRFDGMISTILNSKLFRKQAKKQVGEEGIKELDDMLLKHTSCEIIRE